MCVLVAVVVAALLAGCGLPRDPEGTLERVSGGTLRAGATAHYPYVLLDGQEPTGVEVELVEQFAEEIGATVEWTTGSEEEVFEALAVRALDVVVGGFTVANPWTTEGASTQPYLTTRLTLAIEPGTSVDDDLTGVEVAVRPGSAAAGLMAEAGAVAVPLDPAAPPGIAAVEDWLLDDLGLVAYKSLQESQHVVVVALGENALLVRLERFLLPRRGAVEQRLAREGPPP